MKNRFLFVIVNLFFGVIVFFLIGETCFRLFRGSPNPSADVMQKKMTYLFKPGITKEGKSSVEGEFAYTAQINNYGYRGRDFKMPKDKETLRIMALGDSMTYGVGVNDDQTIPYYLESYLLNNKFPVEVINGGSGHAGTIKHFLNIQNFHLKYQPDLVLLLFDLTDLQDDWYVERHGRYNRKTGEIEGIHPLYVNGKRDWWLTAVHYSAFARYMHDKVVRSYQKWRILGSKRYKQIKEEGKRAKAVIVNSDDISDDVLLQYDYLLMMRGKFRKELIDKQWQRTSKYLLKIRDVLKEKSVPMILVAYPHGIYVSKDEWNEGRATWGFEKNKLYTDTYAFDLMENFAKRNDIPFINTLDNFLKNKGEEKFFYEWDGHMKAGGYRNVAEGIYQSMAFKSLLSKQMGKLGLN